MRTETNIKRVGTRNLPCGNGGANEKDAERTGWIDAAAQSPTEMMLLNREMATAK